MKKVRWIAVTGLSLLIACGGSDQTQEAVPPAPPPIPSPAALSNGEIAHIVTTSSSIAVAASELAKTQAANPDVLRFAQTLAADHNALMRMTEQLTIEPVANATSEQLQAVAKAARVRLEPLAGAEFDRAFIDNEILFHQGMLDTLDRILLPAAQSAELKKLLEETRPALAAHVTRARQIRAQLGS